MYIILFLLVYQTSCRQIIPPNNALNNGTTTTIKLPSPKANGVQFEDCHSLTSVLERAVQSDKFVFMDFYADWCIPCKVMDRDVFDSNEVADIMNRFFINLKINGEALNGPDLAAMHEVSSYPVYLWLDKKGKILKRQEGAINREKFVDITLQVLRDN